MTAPPLMVGVIVPLVPPPPTGVKAGVPTQPAPAVPTVQVFSAPPESPRVNTGIVVQPAPEADLRGRHGNRAALPAVHVYSWGRRECVG